jgi:hypothetical protein
VSIDKIDITLLILIILNSLLMIFIGILGEYVFSTLRLSQKRPVVVEKERVNFDA